MPSSFYISNLTGKELLAHVAAQHPVDALVAELAERFRTVLRDYNDLCAVDDRKDSVIEKLEKDMRELNAEVIELRRLVRPEE